MLSFLLSEVNVLFSILGSFSIDLALVLVGICQQ